jgi:hypothetical protein
LHYRQKKEDKFSSKLSPEDFPDISVVHSTNEKRIHPMAKDILVEDMTVTFHGAELIRDSTLTLSHGRR